MNTLYFLGNNSALLLLVVWVLFWKAPAIWFAAREEKKLWFWALLVVNTVGILEIVYIFAIAKKSWSDFSAFYSGKTTPREITPETTPQSDVK